jgi:hypothetical protein
MTGAIASKQSRRRARGCYAHWTAGNLEVQGYRLPAGERERLRLGLRFATGLCLPLVAAGVWFESPALLAGLAGIGAIAGATPRHPFDLLWNRVVRRAFNAPPVPPSPVRRRNAFKIGAAWLLATAVLFAAGSAATARPLGASLLVPCALATTFHFCVPSYALALLARTRWRPRPSAEVVGSAQRRK